MKDREILRRLAAEYAVISNSDTNREKILLHKAVNDLKAVRPIVLIDELPWHEMNTTGELTLSCTDEKARKAEDFFRKSLFRNKYFPCDSVYRPYYAVEKKINSTGIGFVRKENEHEENALSHTYEDQLQTESDLEKLHFETISYDERGTLEELSYFAEMFGDILPVKITGEATGYGLGLKTMDDIVNLRGLQQLFYDLVERPDFMHRLIGKLTDIFVDKIRQYEKLNLFDGDPYYCHSASALTNDIEAPGETVKAKNVWGRGLAQIFASVSPEMHKEFDIAYMKKALEPFGQVYYGCCEPLDKKIDILEEIPNLRKISITPWADIDIAAEAIGKKYVVSNKAHPASVSMKLNEDALKEEIGRTLSAVKRNSCSCEIILKDISTINGDLNNIIRWEQIVTEAVRNF